MIKPATTLVLIIVTCIGVDAQQVYQRLGHGKHSVGFKILTLNDESRLTIQNYHYAKEEKPARPRTISVHLWYPAVPGSGNSKMSYGDYCISHLQSKTGEAVHEDQRLSELNGRKSAVRNWFGAPDEDGWNKLLAAPMLAEAGAKPEDGQFPLLVGMLRPLSTTIVNEYLASHGYIIAMVVFSPFQIQDFAEMALSDVRDMQVTMSWLASNLNIASDKIGAYGFSGSGFTQVLMTMSDKRIMALADIESGLFMNELFQSLSASNYYKPAQLRVPFLHIFSRDLSKEEKYLSEFENKMRFARRYRVVLNQPALHHWDFASEGYTSCLFLKNRGAEQDNIEKSFELSCLYLLKFFDAELKSNTEATQFMNGKPALANYPVALWDYQALPASDPAPGLDEFDLMIKQKGIDEAYAIARRTIKADSSSTLWNGGRVNALGYTYLGQKKYPEAIGIFKLNAELHPASAGWIDSLAEAYELQGDKENMKKISTEVLNILLKKEQLTNADRSLKQTAERRLQQ